jgi:hypothetical protein
MREGFFGAVYVNVGEKAPRSGIYTCTGLFCDSKRTLPKGRKVPPCAKGHKEWQLKEATTKKR